MLDSSRGDIIEISPQHPPEGEALEPLYLHPILCVHMHTYTHTYTHAHICMHTHMHTQAHIYLCIFLVQPINLSFDQTAAWVHPGQSH